MKSILAKVDADYNKMLIIMYQARSIFEYFLYDVLSHESSVAAND